MSMIAPETYINQCKDMSYEELIEERKRLMDEIVRFEAIKFEGMEDDEEFFLPSPDVRYQCHLNYLAKLCEFMSKKFREMNNKM